MRFASEPYSGGEESLANHYVHLTNFALNRDNTAAGAGHSEAEDGSPASCKWSLPSLRRHLETAGLVRDWAWLWAERTPWKKSMKPRGLPCSGFRAASGAATSTPHSSSGSAASTT